MKKKLYFLALFLIILLCFFIANKVFAPQKDLGGEYNSPQYTLKDLQITYNNATSDNIVVDLPSPGAVTGKTFTVLGKARGPWYFEASFPITVLNEKGEIIAGSIATAKSEWMTTDFVPFEAIITIPESYIGKAVLVLKKDNPSGLPEKDASISFPFTIEY